MLRITPQMDATDTSFELEGKLAGPWIAELERCWRQAVSLDRPVRISLKAVTFIDEAGKKLLAEMHQQGAKLVAEGCMTSAIVEEIMSASNALSRGFVTDPDRFRGRANQRAAR